MMLSRNSNSVVSFFYSYCEEIIRQVEPKKTQYYGQYLALKYILLCFSSMVKRANRKHLEKDFDMERVNSLKTI